MIQGEESLGVTAVLLAAWAGIRSWGKPSCALSSLNIQMGPVRLAPYQQNLLYKNVIEELLNTQTRSAGKRLIFMAWPVSWRGTKGYEYPCYMAGFRIFRHCYISLFLFESQTQIKQNIMLSKNNTLLMQPSNNTHMETSGEATQNPSRWEDHSAPYWTSVMTTAFEPQRLFLLHDHFLFSKRFLLGTA